MEELKSNAELREEVSKWVSWVRSRLEGDITRKMVVTGPFREPWTHALAVSEAIAEDIRWREVAPNPSPRMRFLQVAHRHNLLEWPQPDVAVLAVVPDNPFSPPSRAEMLEALATRLAQRVSIGDVVKMGNGHAVSVNGTCEAPEGLRGFPVRLLTADEIAELPPATVTGERTVTVASPRIDAVAAGVLKPSREQIKKYLDSGGVLLNYKPARKPGIELAPGDVVAVRDGGRFRVDEILGETRKGRVKIRIDVLNGP